MSRIKKRVLNRVLNRAADKTPASQEAADQVNRLNRLSGQVSGIARMIAEGRATTDVLTQFKAVKSALEAVEQNVVQQALREGIERALQAPQRDEAARRLESLFHIHASVSANDVASGAQAPTHLDL